MNRKETLDYLLKVADPLLRAASADRLKKDMPLQEMSEARLKELNIVRPAYDVKANFSYFEGVSRLILGMAPWLVSEPSDKEEAALQQEYAELCRRAIKHQLDPRSNDYAKFNSLACNHSQLLVDIAFLVQGIYRGKAELFDKLDDETRSLLLDALMQCRNIIPWKNNWYLFSAFNEAGIYLLTGKYDIYRVEMIFDQMEEWYVGDSFYKDGSTFAMDYYNSYVILPMLCELAEIFESSWGRKGDKETYYKRLARYTEIQERQVAPDGTFIVIGRSIAYRCGAFHALALAAWKHRLSPRLSPAQVRCALSAVIEKTLSPKSFNEYGFLVIGVSGDQPNIGESYISTGSLYLCSTAFLTLGLPQTDEFWSSEDAPWTQKRIWSGENVDYDRKLQ